MCKTDLLKMVLVVKGRQSGYAMEFLKFSIAALIMEEIALKVFGKSS